MYREVTMIEIREVLRLRGAGLPKKRIATQLGLDPKTVRRYLTAAATAGVAVTATISDEEVRQILLALQPTGGRPRGDGWALCHDHRAAIAHWLGEGLRLTKIRKLLVRQGVQIAYPTLHRFAILELQFGKSATTIPVLDGEPGQEVQVDTGWVGWLTLPQGQKRRFRAWIFAAVRSRHRFVYPTFEETTARAIEASEAAWEFFGGIFTVLIPDNTKAIVVEADPLAARITPAFLEYAQARAFHIDPARVRHAQDKPRALSMEEAASIPLVGLTVWQALIERANLRKGQKVFIQAGSGGVGTFAIQLAKHLGATVATTTSADNVDLVRSLGADIVIDYKQDDFENVLSGYDVVLNSLDKVTLEKSLRVLKPGGKLISISGPPDAAFARSIGASWVLRMVTGRLELQDQSESKAPPSPLLVSFHESERRPADRDHVSHR